MIPVANILVSYSHIKILHLASYKNTLHFSE